MTVKICRHVGAWLGALMIIGTGARGWAADFHITTAQDLQAALTVAAGNGAPDTLWLAAGYYSGNFNYSSVEANDVTLQPEPGVDGTQVAIDGAGTGRALNLACSATANITVTNLTFVRNCGDTDNAALRISTVGADVSVGGCRFLGSTNHQGKGVEIVAGRNACVRNCTVSRTGTATGDGIEISGITGELRVEGNAVTASATGGSDGIRATVSGAGTIWITGNTVRSNAYGITASGIATISGNAVTGNSGYGIDAGLSATISGNTITGNHGSSGGGINAGNSCTISGNTITGNSVSYHGGGIYAGNSCTISGNVISGNSAGGNGGGIHAGSSAAISGNTITGNAADSGGGILAGASATISSNTVASNSAILYGGGIYVSTTSGTTVTISGNLLLRNRVTGTTSTYGGGICASAPTLKVFNNIVAANTSPSGTTGGGLWLKPATRLELINNTVTGNSGGTGGGAAITLAGLTELVYVYNNIIWGNSAAGSGDDVWLAGTGQRKEFLYNNAHDVVGAWELGPPQNHNIDAAPLFYDPLHDEYHLRSGSPGLDAGTNAAAMLPATDLDGDPRIVNTVPDIGADEFNNADYHPADLNNDWVISDAEYNAYAAAWKNDQTWSAGPVPIPADYVTRAGYLKTQNSGVYHNTGGPKPVCWKTGAP